MKEGDICSFFHSLQDAIKWSLNVEYVTTEGRGQFAHLWNLINVCLNWYKVISEGIQRRKRIFLRGACQNQCLNCQMQDILWGPHSVKLSSEATIYLVNQYRWVGMRLPLQVFCLAFILRDESPLFIIHLASMSRHRDSKAVIRKQLLCESGPTSLSLFVPSLLSSLNFLQK